MKKFFQIYFAEGATGVFALLWFIGVACFITWLFLYSQPPSH